MISVKNNVKYFQCAKFDGLGILNHECINSGPHVARATKFHTVAPNISGPSVWSWCLGTFLASRILNLLLHFGIICALFVDTVLTSQ